MEIENDPFTKRYITGERDLLSLADAALSELQVAREVRERTGNNELISSSVAMQAFLDMTLTHRLSSWLQDDQIKRQTRKSTDRYLSSQEKGIQLTANDNREFIHSHGLNWSVAVTAAVSDFIVHYPSDHQNWTPRLLELWARFGHRNAFSPIFKDLFTRKYQPYANPSTQTIHQCLMRTGLASEALTMTDEMYQTISEKHVSQGRKKYMATMMSGLLLEYDALVYLYESNTEVSPGHGLWHIPAPINLDINPNGTVKADILSIHLSLGRCNGSVGAIDVKSKPSKKRKKEASASPQILDAAKIGCTKLLNGKQVVTPGLLCKEYVQAYFDDGKIPLTNIDERFAVGLAIAGGSLPNIEDIYYANRAKGGLDLLS